MIQYKGPAKYVPKIEEEGQWAGKVKPVIFRPDFGDNDQTWPTNSINGNSVNPLDYGYPHIPLMCYGQEKRSIWLYEYRELIRATLLYLQIFMKTVYNVPYSNHPVKKYYLKRQSRIAFWNKPTIK
jgi:hypothetical protein